MRACLARGGPTGHPARQSVNITRSMISFFLRPEGLLLCSEEREEDLACRWASLTPLAPKIQNVSNMLENN